MTTKYLTLAVVAASSMLVAACGSGPDGVLSTASVSPDTSKTAVAVNPACVTLSSKIDSLKSDGTVERLEKAATGSTASVKIKREAIARQAELNKTYAEYQQTCGPKIPAIRSAAVAPAVAPVAPTAATTAPAKAAVKAVESQAKDAAADAVKAKAASATTTAVTKAATAAN